MVVGFFFVLYVLIKNSASDSFLDVICNMVSGTISKNSHTVSLKTIFFPILDKSFPGA